MLPTIIAGCDTNYYFEHGLHFANSCIANGMPYELHVINNLEGKRAKEFASLPSVPNVIHHLDMGLNIANKNAYYAALRFIVMPEVLANNEGILIVDVDSVLNGPITIDDSVDIGLFYRGEGAIVGNESNPYLREAGKVAAGLVYVRNNKVGMEFATWVSNRLRQIPLHWYADQVTLYHAYLEFKDRATIQHFDKRHLSWEFDDPTTWIYTAKGALKSNSSYLAIKERYAISTNDE